MSLTEKLSAEKFQEFLKNFQNKSKAVDDASFDIKDVCKLSEDKDWAFCFIRYTKFDLSLAANAAVKCLQWRKANGIRNLNPNTVNQELLAKGAIYVKGRDVDGYRILYMHIRKMSIRKSSEYKQIFLLWLEILQSNETGKQITLIMDMKSAGITNVNVSSIKFIMECLEMYFPSILNRIVVVDFSWIFNPLWKLVNQWLTEEKRKKITFKTTNELTSLIDRKQLVQILGGEETDWCYIKDHFDDDNIIKRGESIS